MQNIIIIIKFPKTAIVMFNNGAFGGASKRYAQLYIELIKKHPEDIHLFLNNHLYSQITTIFPEINKSNIHLVDSDEKPAAAIPENTTTFYPDHIPDPLDIDKDASLARKIYWYYKNFLKQKILFHKIERLRETLGIKVLNGISAGIMPLVFYINNSPRKAAVIVSNTDSWFSDVHSDMKKLWYRKYYSYNFAFENADVVDFLSPYILDGVKKRNVNIKDDSISVAPCSFIDFSKCSAGNKSNLEIAFCARLEPDKNPLMYLEAANIIHKKYPDVKFHLLGEGTLVYEIEKYIEYNSLAGTVNFTFHKNPPEIFSGTSIFVSLQTGTNYPSQSVLEAMACENTVIATNVGDTNMFINKDNGILIPLSAESLADAMEKLIRDRVFCSRLAANAKKFVYENHTAEKYINYYEEMVIRACKKHF